MIMIILYFSDIIDNIIIFSHGTSSLMRARTTATIATDSGA